MKTEKRTSEQVKMSLREKFKKEMLDRTDIDIKNINSSERKEKSEAVTTEYIISQMFNREIFYMKLEDPCMFMLLTEEPTKLIKQFSEAGYRRVEGRWLVWTAGIRYERCKEFVESSLYGLAMSVMEKDVIRVAPHKKPAEVPPPPVLGE